MPKVSKEDEDLLKYSWRNKRGYPSRKVWCSKRKRKVDKMLHRIILSRMLGRALTQQDICDHINGDKENSSRDNLRLTDKLGNGQNRKCGPFRGASQHPVHGKWVARVKLRGVTHYLGCYDTQEEAASVAKKKREELGFLGGTTESANPTPQNPANRTEGPLECPLDPSSDSNPNA